MTIEEQERVARLILKKIFRRVFDDLFKEPRQDSKSPLLGVLKDGKCGGVFPDDWASRSPKFKSPKSLPSLKGVASLSDNKPSK